MYNTLKNKGQAVRKQMVKTTKPALSVPDNRPQTTVQKKQLLGMNPEPVAAKPIQQKNSNTGLPDQLKTGVENLSGISMNDVQVHFNSPKPAQLQAHAYAQGTEIHLAPGQEKHLPHEAWHVVQQKQGRVKPTMQLKGKLNINNDVVLEHEADTMGAKAAAYQAKAMHPETGVDSIIPGTTARLAQLKYALPPSVIQARIIINGQAYTHGSKKWVDHLFETVVAPNLEQSGYKVYGAKSALVRFIRQFRDIIPQKTYLNTGAFWKEFFPWLMQQERKVRGNKTTKTIKPFNIDKMSRPAWPKDYKEKLGTIVGDNIRHVIRNATLKRALKVDFDLKKSGSVSALRQHLFNYAEMLQIPVSESATVDVLMKLVYKKLYLNIDNLFSGVGSVNQVIGFASDPVREWGEDLVASGDELMDIRVAFGHVFGILDMTLGKIRKSNLQEAQHFVKELITSLINVAESIKDEFGGTYDVPAEVLGDIISNIGLNFGFDLVDGRVDNDQQNISERQNRLLQVEVELQEYISSNGQKGELAAIMKKFLDVHEEGPQSSSEDLSMSDEETTHSTKKMPHNIGAAAAEFMGLNFVRINGNGLNCYIRSLVTALVNSGHLHGTVEYWVDTVTDHLQHTGLRVGAQEIDAGGLVAAEVRLAIFELTGGAHLGGVDVGVRIVQWDGHLGAFQQYMANMGTGPLITLLYTPGHFDLLQ